MKRYTIPSLLLASWLLFSTFGYAQTIMLQEFFEGSFPPAGWTIVNNVVGGSWQSNVSRGVPNYCAAGSGDCAVAHPGDTNNVSWDTEMRSPPVDLTSATWASLTYASMFQDYAGNGELWVDISIDGGTTWVTLRNQTSDDPPGGTPAPGGTSEIEDLAGYLGHNVLLRWRFQASNTAAWCFHVDSVEVQAVLAIFPEITSISPSNGPIEGGTLVTIDGIHFTPGAAVTFGGYSSTVLYTDATKIIVKTPPHPDGAVDVTVTNPDLRSGTSSGGFTYGTPTTISQDSDGDGIPDDTERGCNNTQPNYDGNGDQTSDYIQSSVATFSAIGADGIVICMTVAVPRGQQIYQPSVKKSQNTPRWQRFPYGLLSVDHINLNGDTATTLTLFVDGSSIQNYWLYGKTPDNPTDHWYSFLYDGETGAEIMDDRVVLHFVDGQRGDNDLTVDGFIFPCLGGSAEGIQRAELYYPYLGASHNASTEMGLINLDPHSAAVELDYYDSNGELITTISTHINAMGKKTISHEAIPADAVSAVVAADATIAGYTRSTGPAGQRCAWPAHDSLYKTVVVPVVAKNNEWRTMIAACNPDDNVIVVTSIHASGAFYEYYVKPFGQLILWPDQEDPLLFLEADTGIAAIEILENLDAQGDFSALMLTNRPTGGQVVLPYIPQGVESFTGIGMINRAFSGVVGIFGYTQTGEINVAFAGEWLPYARNVFFLNAFLDETSQWARIVGRSATVTPFGRYPMYMDGLVIYAQTYPSSLGGVNLSALPFKDGYFGVANGQTTVALANANLADATVTVTGFGKDGTVTGTGVLSVPMTTNRVIGVQDLLGDADPEQTTHIHLESDVSLSGLEIITTDGRMEVLPVLKTP